MATPIDGPTLRALRLSKGLTLRRVSRESRMSHGHIAKVEVGEPGRAVTPAVLAAYERATGVRLTAGDGPGGWRPGQLGVAQQRAYLGRIGAAAVGGLPERRPHRLLAQHGLDRPAATDTASLQKLAEALDGIDGCGGPAAAAVLRWAVELADDDDAEPEPVLCEALGMLARRAGAGAVERQRHETARAYYLLALQFAARADAVPLRGRVLAEIAHHHLRLDQPEVALAAVRLAEVDERTPEPVRGLLGEVKARAVAALEQVQAAVTEALIRAD